MRAGIGTYLKIVLVLRPADRGAAEASAEASRDAIRAGNPRGDGPVASTDAISVLSATSLKNVVVMLNDLLWLRQQCEELDAHFNGLVELCATDPQYEEFSDRGVKTSNYQMRTIQVALDMVYLPSVIDYLGARVAYFELRAPFLGRLFSPTVARSPPTRSSRPSTPWCCRRSGRPHHEVGARVYEAVCRWCLNALHILLDGGRIRSTRPRPARSTPSSRSCCSSLRRIWPCQSASEQDVRPVVRVLHWMAMDYGRCATSSRRCQRSPRRRWAC